MQQSGLRFAMITTFYPPHHFGGDAGYVRQLSQILARQGHEVDVIHDLDAFRILSARSPEAAIDESPGVKIHGMTSKWPKLSCLATHQFARPVVHGTTIRRILDERKPDIIHFHNTSLVGGPGVLAYGEGIKIYTAHEHWLVCPTHVLWRNNKELCEEKRCLKCSLTYYRPPQLWRRTGYLKRQSANVDQFCSFSQFSVDMHKKFGFEAPMRVLPSFISDIEKQEKALAPSGYQGRPYFLFVGRLERIKGVQNIIPAFRDKADAELWVVGSGTYEPVLRKLAGGSDNIRFLGKREPHELRSFYAHAVALLVPSICYEVFPMVILEAFREGVPVITSSFGPFPEIIRKSGGGLVFDSEDELRESIKRMAYDSAARETMAKSARASFLEHWSERAGMRAYFSLIKEIAVRRKQSRVLDVLATCDEFGRLNK
jgi:glycosyltransferase involved in cell wall biosynthesis